MHEGKLISIAKTSLVYVKGYERQGTRNGLIWDRVAQWEHSDHKLKKVLKIRTEGTGGKKRKNCTEVVPYLDRAYGTDGNIF